MPSDTPHTSTAPTVPGKPLLRISGLAKSYREGGQVRAVWSGIDLEVRRGQVVVLFGRSGSGKTTLLNVISGLDSADHGHVEIDGSVLSTLDETRRTLFRRARIGFIHQFFNLLPTLNVMENLLLPLELNERADAAGLAHATDLLGRIGLADRAQSYPDQLSGGEQQRVAVARALVHAPDLVLADEPTGNLDDITGRQVLELLLALTRDRGHTLLMVSHSPQTAALADAVYALAAGGLEQLVADAVT
jgi:putative ABC transport system ATP-binding protein